MREIRAVHNLRKAELIHEAESGAKACGMSVSPGLARLEFPPPDAIAFDDVLAIYEALRPVMPRPAKGVRTTRLARLGDVLGLVDAVVLDAFGIINVGAAPIDGIHEFLAQAADRGVAVMVLTNGAGQGAAFSWKKYRAWDLDLELDQVVSSRDSLERELESAGFESPIATIGPGVRPLGIEGELVLGEAPDLFERARTFAFLGSGLWEERHQTLLEAAIAEGGKRLLVANPDVSAPLGESFSAEPGYWAARAMKHTGVAVDWFGKPHTAAFELVLERLARRHGRQFDPGRVAMIGDSLHTDVLGAAAAGFRSVLVTGYGLFAGGGAGEMMERTQIAPDWITDGF